MYFRTLPATILTVFLACLSARHVAAQGPAPARTAPGFNLSVPEFSDGDVNQMLESLDVSVSRAPAQPDLRLTFWDFARGMQTGRMTPLQEARVLQHLGGIAGSRPGDVNFVDGAKHMVSALTVGKVAPEIVGTDLDGHALRLSDYRGKVVVLMFSGDWCGVCRGQYPYERLMLELYRNWPFAILGVDSSVSLARAREVKQDERLTYASWWDGGGAKNTDGPIASAWNVQGWPTVYVIDQTGVIRFVDLRSEDLLKGVRLLLTEKPGAPARLF